jgi:hypothetical protein
MNRDLVNRVVNAVLYEGYVLYPYRPSVKNRQRWTFGGLYPQAYCAHGAGDAWAMQVECLVEGAAHTAIQGTVRFLHLIERRVGALDEPLSAWPEAGPPPVRFVPSLQVGDRLVHAWQEAAERTMSIAEVELGSLLGRPHETAFTFPGETYWEPLPDPAGRIVGAIVRERQAVCGTVELAAAQVADDLYRVTVRVLNRTSWEPAGEPNRDAALLRAMASTHAVLGVRDGAFVSLTDPPAAWRKHAEACQNVGAWPVLVGAAGERDTLLASPIILPDYPQVAPESPGDLFDATEIDEILTLRILTLTEDEKRQAVAVDERARALLQRTEALPREQLMGLHGTMRPAAEGERHAGLGSLER